MRSPHLFNQKGQAGSSKLHISPKINAGMFSRFLPQAIKILLQTQFIFQGEICLISHLLLIRKVAMNVKGNLPKKGSQHFLSKKFDVKKKKKKINHFYYLNITATIRLCYLLWTFILQTAAIPSGGGRKDLRRSSRTTAVP